MKNSLRSWLTRLTVFSCISVFTIANAAWWTSPQAQAADKTATNKPSIALTMTYTGNAWGHSAQQYFIATAKKLKKEGKISAYYTANANNSASTQSSQIEGYVLKHVSAIIVEPSSPTALNSAIAQAHAAKIPVIVIETGPVTSKYAYEINPNVSQLGYDTMKAAVSRLHGKGNILYMQGVAGNPFSVDFKKGVEKAAHQYHRAHLILGPFGNWTTSTSESVLTAALPSMPKINGLISEGGEYGALQAILNAGRPLPVAIGDNYGPFMRWWGKYHKTHAKYKTESLEANPWISGAAAYVAINLAQGIKLPLQLHWPVLTVTNPEKFKNISVHSVAGQAYNQSWVKIHVEGK